MWYEGNQNKKEVQNFNKWCLENLKGDLDENEAKKTLVEFLRRNLSFTVDLLSGGDLKIYPYQEIILKSWMLRNYSINVWGRGFGKTFTVSIFAILYCIFNPKSKIVIASSNFRTSRNIMNHIDMFVGMKNATLLKQCFLEKDNRGKVQGLIRRNDEWNWNVNGGSIKALPLTEGTRGVRADVLILDEFLLLPQEVVDKVLMPFLTASSDQNTKMKIREREDSLIAAGKMKEGDRLQFDSDKKMIILSSASYEFEYLYKKFKAWKGKILGEEVSSEEENNIMNATYFVSQFSYEAAPRDLIDPAIIEEAENGGASNAVFQREYCAQFVDDSDSFFSAKKMSLCTVKDGENPCTEIIGDKNSEYILSIDPNASSSKSSDHFAMSVLKLHPESQMCTLVHNYGTAGFDFKNNIEYFYYLITHFNIVYIIMDNAGCHFIEACNNSSLFKDNNVKLDFFENCFDDTDAKAGIYKSKKSYNLVNRKIIHSQHFGSIWIRKSNEYLQGCIDNKTIWFASKCSLNEIEYKRALYKSVPKLKAANSLEGEENISNIDLIACQDDWIDLVKKECSLVQMSMSPQGSMRFDLPTHLKKSMSANKARKDNYTTLLLGVWGAKCYFEMNNLKQEDQNAGMQPFFL